MKEIVVNSPKHGIHTVLIDDEDYDKVKQYNWGVKKNGNTFYVARMIHVDGKRTPQSLHRFIMGLESGNIDKRVIDHLDGNGLNNQKANLRICSQMENIQSHRRVNAKSPFKNFRITKNNTFKAEININGKRFQKNFKTEDQAKEYIQNIKNSIDE